MPENTKMSRKTIENGTFGSEKFPLAGLAGLWNLLPEIIYEKPS
jgi:hypothetical protein